MLCLMHFINHVVIIYIKNLKKKKKIQEKSFKKKKKKIFGLGALGLQVISIHFQKEISRLGVLAFLVNFF